MRAAILALAILFSTPALAQNYGQVQARGAQQVNVAQVIQVSSVRLDVRNNTGVGSQVGYTLGNSIGSNNYNLRQITSQLGRSIGREMEARRTVRGVEILVRDTRGRVFSIVQEGHAAVQAGDTVALVGQGNQMRVIRIEPEAARTCSNSDCTVW